MLGFVHRDLLVQANTQVKPVSPNTNVSLLDAHKDQCKYPLWGDDEKNGLVCGAQRTHEKSSWCAYHESIVYRIPPDRSTKQA